MGRLIATNGASDPNRPYGITETDVSRQIYAYLIDYVGHIADYHEPDSSDGPSLVGARTFVIEKLELLLYG